MATWLLLFRRRKARSSSPPRACCEFNLIPAEVAQANANSALRTFLRSREPYCGGADGSALGVLLTKICAGLIEHLSQHVMLLVHPDELFPNDLAETLRHATANNRSCHEQ